MESLQDSLGLTVSISLARLHCETCHNYVVIKKCNIILAECSIFQQITYLHLISKNGAMEIGVPKVKITVELFIRLT